MSHHLISGAHYEFFPHHQDLGLRGVGWTLEDAFEQVALALANITMDVEKIQEEESIHIECQSPNHEGLLADWINAIIYEAGIRKIAFKRFQVSFEDRRLHGQAWGEKLHSDSAHFPVDAKGVLSESIVVGEEQDGRWVAQCVVKI